MAARSHKIFREILFKHYRYNSKIVSPIFSNVIRNCSQNVTKKKLPSLKLTHSEFGKDLANSYLQPALLPAFSTNHKTFDVKWPQTERITTTRTKVTVKDASKSKISSPFLNSITRNTGLATQNRNYSTLISFTRQYSNKKWGDQTDSEECPTRRECYKPCPKWQLHNCPPQGDNLECLKPYTDPCCKKKLAPYPSYSESCAERLEDDPSECMQCPWKRCGGSESLKYPKRKYHTGTSAAFHRFTTTAAPPIDIARVEIPIRCDAKKPPCKRPPGKCDKHQKVEPCPEKKGPCPPPFERKKCDKEKKASNRWIDVCQMWNDKNSIVPMTENWIDVIDPIEEQSPAVAIRTKKTDDDCKGDMITPDNSCCLKLPFDKKQMDYESIRHKKCHKPNCKRKKRKMVPDGCDGWCNKKCASSETQILFDVGYECQKKKKRCPRDDCHRPKCPDRDMIIDNHMELAREHDKGHPPPCPNWRKPSKQCPKPEKCKKPYRQQHDLNEPFYRRNKKPWAEIDRGHGERKPDMYS